MIWLVFFLSRLVPSGAGNDRCISIDFLFPTLELTEFRLSILINLY